MTLAHRDLIACAALLLLWVLPMGFIGVGGEFPLLDDWAYARTTHTWLETGQFERVEYTYATLVTHVGIGALFSWVLGFSFEALRWSSLAMGGAGVLGAYTLCRQLGAPSGVSFVAGLLFAFNPVHVLLSYTFMTDVSFTALITWSLVAMVRGLRRGAPAWIGAGVALALLATLSRQTGLLLAVALVAAVMAGQLRRPRIWVPVAVGTAALFAVYALVPSLFLDAGDTGAQGAFHYYLTKVLFGPHALFFTARNALSSFAYLGLFLGPAALLGAPAGPRGRALAAIAALAGSATTAALAWVDWPMPLGMNLIYDFGLGPLTVAGQEELPHAPSLLWWTLTWLAFAGGTSVVGRLGLALWDRRKTLLDDSAWLLPLLFAALHLGVLIVRWPFFDRWLLPVVPALSAVLLLRDSEGRTSRWASACAVAALAGFFAYGVLGTRDFLDHHRARWSLLTPLLEEGVSPRRIDGGKEFNAHYNYALDRSGFLDRGGRHWVVDDEYLISLANRVPGFRPRATRSSRRWLSPGTARVTLHERVSEARGPGAFPPAAHTANDAARAGTRDRRSADLDAARPERTPRR